LPSAHDCHHKRIQTIDNWRVEIPSKPEHAEDFVEDDGSRIPASQSQRRHRPGLGKSRRPLPLGYKLECSSSTRNWRTRDGRGVVPGIQRQRASHGAPEWMKAAADCGDPSPVPGMLGTDDRAREATILAHSHSAYHSSQFGEDHQLMEGTRSLIGLSDTDPSARGVFLAGWVGELGDPLSELHH